MLLEQYQGRAAYLGSRVAALTLAVRHWLKYLLGRRVVFIADQIPVVNGVSRLFTVVDAIILTTKPCKGMVDPVRHGAECDKPSLVRSQPYTHSASAELTKDYSNAEEGWVPEKDLEPVIQCIVSNTDVWGIARTELLINLKEQKNTVEELAILGKDDAEVYLNVVKRARRALEDAQRCCMLGKANCSAEEWESYVQLAQVIGIMDYNILAPALTPLRLISTGGVLWNSNMSGAAWVQIDHGNVWELQKELH